MTLLRDNLDSMGYRPSYADPDLWLLPAVKPDGFEYYEYILCHVDNVLCISCNLRKQMKRFWGYFKLKDNKIETLEVYLGASLANMKLYSGKYCWSKSPEQYVKVAVTNVEEDLSRNGKILPSKCVTPLLINYAPWLEDFLELMVVGL